VTTLQILPWSIRALGDIPAHAYHGVLGSLGYESRSRMIPLQLASSEVKVAPAFVGQHVGAYETNRRELEAADFDVTPVADPDFPELVRRFVAAAAKSAGEVVCRVAFDISSMSRWRIASVVEELTADDAGGRTVADLLYAPAEFTPPFDADVPVLSVEPVSAYLSGWWDDLDQPLATIIGVGYESEHASSAVDRLEPEDSFVFVPHGADSRYLIEVEAANEPLLKAAQHSNTIGSYEVTEPYATLQALDTLIRRLRRDHRIAIVPLGPKVFAACAAIAGCLHHPAVQLIRVTANDRREPIDSRIDGTVCGLRIASGSVDDAALYAAEEAVPTRPFVQAGDAERP
jgi:hypothetical protein